MPKRATKITIDFVTTDEWTDDGVRAFVEEIRSIYGGNLNIDYIDAGWEVTELESDEEGRCELLVVVSDMHDLMEVIRDIEAQIGVEADRHYPWPDDGGGGYDVVFYVDERDISRIDDVLSKHPRVKGFNFGDDFSY